MAGVFELVGFALLTLAGLSGLALFLKSVAGKADNMNTLWGLFLIGLSAGLFLLAGAHSNWR